MTGFEYKVVPAPNRGLKAKGVKGTPARFANALEVLMNELGAEGWEYQRTDTLPVEERQGLTGKTTSFQNMLVFRRALEEPEAEAPNVTALIEDQSPTEAPAPVPNAPLQEPEAEPVEAAEPQTEDAPAADDADDADDATRRDPMRFAADKRVSDTIEAPFVFPWSKRGNRKPPQVANSDDSKFPAE